MTTPPPAEASSSSWPDSPSREWLSALSDGEVAGDHAVAELVRAWQSESEARADWHAFQLIGDVLRSEELGSTAEHDEKFLRAMRARLAQEPVVLARSKRMAPSSWAWPAAMAAVVLVSASALLTSSRYFSPGPEAVGTVAATQPSAVNTAESPDPSSALVLRDAQLDLYLQAHQQFVGTSALGVPSGFIRNATVEAPRR